MKLNFNIDKTSPQKIYLQLYDAFKLIIESGEILPNEKLPSIRQIAIKYGISHLTVLKTYELLEKNNLIFKINGKGCYVKENNSLASKNQKPIINNFAIINKSINFASATPSTELYPIKEFQNIINEIFDNYGDKVFNYFDTQGLLELREILVEKLKTFNISTTSSNIQIVSGSQQALDILKKIISKKKNTTIVVGSPTYYGAINTFSEVTKMLSVPVLEDGFDLIELEKILQNNKIDFLYTMINFECPTGISWSLEKKLKILELANKYKFTIIEDDCMSEFYYFDNPSIPLKALDTNDKVIYINSFSKMIMPGLRVGYMVLPSKSIQDVIAAKFSSDISSSGLMQMAIYLFLKRGYLNSHIEKLREIFKERYEVTLSILKDIDILELTFLPKGGLYFWLKLPNEVNSNILYNLLKEKKVSILPSSVFFLLEEQNNNYIRLSFTSVTLEEIKDGLQILKDTIYDLLEKKDFPSIL